MSQVKLPFYAKLALILLATVLTLFMLMMGRDLFIPLVFALFISILLLPISKFVEHKLRLGRSLAAIISVIIFIGAIGAFMYFFTLQIIHFSEDLPMLQARMHTMIVNFQGWLSSEYHINTRQQTDYLNKSAAGIAAGVANSVGNIFLSFAGMALLVIFVFIFTFFMLFHRGLLLNFVLHLFNPYHRDQVQEVVTETRTMINSYILGLLIEMLIISIVNCTVFALLGVKYSLLLGVMIAVLNIIPYIGIYTGLAITMLLTLANSDLHHALMVAIAIIAIHFVDSNILMPRIVGARVKMNPLITIVVVLLGHYIWGIPGMFLFIPITGMIKIICERVDGLQPWAILIGTEDHKKLRPKKKLPTTDTQNKGV